MRKRGARQYPNQLPADRRRSMSPTSPVRRTALRTFLDAMVVDDYPTMYAMLTQASQTAITQDDFAKRYTDDLNCPQRKQRSNTISCPC